VSAQDGVRTALLDPAVDDQNRRLSRSWMAA
jgi:hypothetical protein